MCKRSNKISVNQVEYQLLILDITFFNKLELHQN